MTIFDNSLPLSRPSARNHRKEIFDTISHIVRVTFFVLIFACSQSITAQTRQWSAQPGTANADSAQGSAVDAIYLYLVGTTAGTMGRTSQGQRDAFLLQFDRSSGAQLWAQQIGSSGDDEATAVTLDHLGNIYVVGTTTGTLPGGRQSGGMDVWIAKYDLTGRQLWLKQLGTASDDSATSITADHGGHIVVVGSTAGSFGGPNQGEDDAWIGSFDSNGNQLWLTQLGTSTKDLISSVTTDFGGDIYVAGLTKGDLSGTNLGEADAFMARYDTAGNQRWLRQFGTSAFDIGKAIRADSFGRILLAGYTYGAISGANAGGSDAFIGQFDSNGTQQWFRQFGTPADDFANSVTVDALDRVYLAGGTMGSLADVNQGLSDIWAASYDSQGARVWIHQTGTASQDSLAGVSVHESSVYLAGTSAGSLGDSNVGGDDAYALEYSQTPTLVSFIPSSGATGTAVIIRGANYYGVSSVTFNGASASFTVNSATQLTATLPAPATTGRIRITTAYGIATSATNFTVTTTPAVSLNLTPMTRIINAGQTTTFDISIARANYPGAVSLAVSGQPAGSSVSFSTNPVTSSFSRLSITPPLNTTAGTYNLTIRGTATGINIPPVVATLTVNVVRVTLTASVTSRSVYAGNAATYSITVNRTNYTGAVDLFGQFNLPTGVTASFNPSHVTGNISTLTLQTNSLTPVGSLTFTILGSVPGLTIAPVSVTLTIDPPPVTLVAGNSTNTITACESASYDILINRTNFSGLVDLSVSGLPTDGTGVFSSDPTMANRSTLTVITKCSTPAGANTLFVSATAPGFNIVPISVTLTVNPNPTYSQLGNEPIDGMTVDSNGNIYLVGRTSTDIDGSGPEIHAGSRDGWVAKYSSAGVLRWVRQLGTLNDDSAYSVAVSSGNVYVAGSTGGDMDGAGPATSFGSDVWVAKFNSTGTRQWITQYGAMDESRSPRKIAVDGGGNVFVDGKLSTAINWGNGSFLVRFTSSGAFSWSRDFNESGSIDDHHYTTDLRCDSAGNAYLVSGGWSSSPFNPWHVTQLEKYDSMGTVVLQDTIFDGDTFYERVAVDSVGNIYLSGSTLIDFDGNGPGMHAGSSDAWLAKYDSNFNLIWSTQFGSSSSDEAQDLRVEGADVYLTGSTFGDLDGAGPGTASNAGAGKWAAKLNSSGQMLRLRQGGLPSFGWVVALDGLGSVYFADQTQVAKFSDSVLPYISSFTPTVANPGNTVTISGNYFTGATAVTFNGVPAVFTVNSPTQITATVPGAPSMGKIMVATPCGVAFSTVDFIPFGI